MDISLKDPLRSCLHLHMYTKMAFLPETAGNMRPFGCSEFLRHLSIQSVWTPSRQ